MKSGEPGFNRRLNSGRTLPLHRRLIAGGGSAPRGTSGTAWQEAGVGKFTNKTTAGTVKMLKTGGSFATMFIKHSTNCITDYFRTLKKAEHLRQVCPE